MDALLLIGPTGSGKTPLGDHLATHGINGCQCSHFDFGAWLRRAAKGELPAGVLSPDQLAVVREVLAKHSLLPPERFDVAESILAWFIGENKVGADHYVVLNGLPRSVYQAQRIGEIVEVQMVFALSCSAEVVRERIEHNPGGDRTDRIDDEPADISAKLELYRQETMPLVEHYAALGKRIINVDVRVNYSAQNLWEELCAQLAE